MIRLFVAIEIPEDVREELTHLQAGLPGATWSPEENMHLTLRFIGEVREPMVEEISEALWRIQAEGFALKLSGVDRFGGEGPRSPARLVFAGVEPVPALMRLQSKIEFALQDLGLEAEQRKFRPHITLARLKDTPMTRLGDFLAEHSLYRSRSFAVSEFALFSSMLGRDHSVYDAIDRFALPPPAKPG
jgi:2'-5' RNA ligase